MTKIIEQVKRVNPEFQVRRGAIKFESGLGLTHIAKVLFDTAATDSSGASNKTVAAHGLGVYLPANAIIKNAWTDVITAFTSATSAATVAIKTEGTGDIVAAIAINSGSSRWASGLGGGLPGSYAEATVAGDTAILDAARKAGSYIKTTAEREITVTNAVEALTAGKMYIFVEYVVSGL